MTTAVGARHTISVRASVPPACAAIVGGYTTSLFLLTKVWQAGVPVGVAYGIWGAVGTAVTAVLGMVIFDEPLTLAIVIGIALIIAGVLAVELGSRPESKT